MTQPISSIEFPKNPSDWMVLGLALLLAFWGGAIQYYSRWRRHGKGAVSYIELIADMASGGFSGLITFLICMLFGAPLILAVLLASIGGHLGTRSLFVFERKVLTRLPLTEREVAEILEPPTGFPRPKASPQNPGSEPSGQGKIDDL